MTLLRIKDGDISVSAGMNTPLKKVEKSVNATPGHSIYQKTGTEGVVLNTQTGKMETQLPDPTEPQTQIPIP